MKGVGEKVENVLFLLIVLISLTFKQVSKIRKFTANIFLLCAYMNRNLLQSVCECNCIQLTLRIYYKVGVGDGFLGVKEQIILFQI